MNRSDEEGDSGMFILKVMLYLTNKVVRFQSCYKFTINNSLHHLNDNRCKADGTIVRGKMFIVFFMNRNDISGYPVSG